MVMCAQSYQPSQIVEREWDLTGIEFFWAE